MGFSSVFHEPRPLRTDIINLAVARIDLGMQRTFLSRVRIFCGLRVQTCRKMWFLQVNRTFVETSLMWGTLRLHCLIPTENEPQNANKSPSLRRCMVAITCSIAIVGAPSLSVNSETKQVTSHHYFPQTSAFVIASESELCAALWQPTPEKN